MYIHTLRLDFFVFFAILSAQALAQTAAPAGVPPPGKLEIVPYQGAISPLMEAARTEAVAYQWPVLSPFAPGHGGPSSFSPRARDETLDALGLWARASDAKLLLATGASATAQSACNDAALAPQEQGAARLLGEALSAFGQTQKLRWVRVGIAQSCVEQATAQAVFAGLGALRPSAQTVQPKLPDTASADDLQTLLQTIAQSNPPKAEVTILVATPAVIANLLKSLNTRNRPLSTGSVMPEGVYALRVNDGAWQVATALSWSRLQTLASDKSSKPSKR